MSQSMQRMSRRTFLAGAVTMAGAAALPRRSFAKNARYVRYSMTSTEGLAMLESYKIAIKALLKLDPADPRNWYRNAFVHTLDCPHGNWWFLPWHRGYLGWFEQVVREFSGNQDFAFPFWDWTDTPMIPPSFWQGVLNPSDPEYIPTLVEFEKALGGPMDAFWKSFSQSQIYEQKLRGYNSMADVWAKVRNNPMFYPLNQARSLTETHPDFDASTQKAVSRPTVQSALDNTDFIGFGSDKASYHSEMVGFGILEDQPHNLVHNCVGGFMGDFLSPVDPIFFMHHSNIDRLWTIWTAKQELQGLPTLPTGNDLKPWSNEPFLFFNNAQGHPVSQTVAGDYAQTDLFDYEYGPGSFGMPAAMARAMATAVRIPRPIAAQVTRMARGSEATVALPQASLAALAHRGRQTLVVDITVAAGPHLRGSSLDVFIGNGAEGTLKPESRQFIGSLEFFGMHHHSRPVTFELPLEQGAEAAAKAGLVGAETPLRLELIPRQRGLAATQAVPEPITPTAVRVRTL